MDSCRAECAVSVKTQTTWCEHCRLVTASSRSLEGARGPTPCVAHTANSRSLQWRCELRRFRDERSALPAEFIDVSAPSNAKRGTFSVFFSFVFSRFLWAELRPSDSSAGPSSQPVGQPALDAASTVQAFTAASYAASCAARRGACRVACSIAAAPK